ncbi:polysaccharide deacetylase family protein [Acidobacteria bacterium AH-259-G07]|nr:polysaccharide deacetylase family protein [Acidobacteria bacterium AH-259-G07]
MISINDDLKIKHGNRGDKKIALTFDDGPNPYFTLKILDLLKSQGVQASFFIIGRWAEKYPDILRRIHKESHSIGNHTFSHGGDHDDDAKFGDYRRCEETIENIIGIKPRYIRVPGFGYGHPVRVRELRKYDLQNREYLIIDHDINSDDTNLDISPTQIIEKVTREIKPGSIIDCHDGCGSHKVHPETGEVIKPLDELLKERPKAIYQALPEIIRVLKSQGFELVSLDKMNLLG